jgi:phosphate transport system substrate-binding protein
MMISEWMKIKLNKMKNLTVKIYITVFILAQSIFTFAQEKENKKVVITGVRFSYPLVQQWINDYKEVNPDANVVIESRTTTDPAKYDLLIEAYEQDEATRENRDYLYLARYALLPFTNATSALTKECGAKGFSKDLIKQIYFNDIYADKDKAKKINANYTVYTRLQKAGAPITFSKYFGYQQSNIKGKAISGADEHLVKAVIRDSSAVSYSVPTLLYDLESRKQLTGIAIIPVDADDNGRVSNDEKFYENLDEVITRIESTELKNIPTEYVHLSISKHDKNPEAVKFLRWVIYNGQESLNKYGFLKPEPKRFQKEKEKFEELASEELASNNRK